MNEMTNLIPRQIGIAEDGVYDVRQNRKLVGRLVVSGAGTTQRWHMSHHFHAVGSKEAGETTTLHLAWRDDPIDAAISKIDDENAIDHVIVATCELGPIPPATRQIDPGRHQIFQDGVLTGFVSSDVTEQSVALRGRAKPPYIEKWSLNAEDDPHPFRAAGKTTGEVELTFKRATNGGPPPRGTRVVAKCETR